MLRGVEVELTRSGIVIPPKTMQALGVYDGSVCWGVLVPNPDRVGKPPHILISPFPLATWGTLLRFELRLADKRGAMLTAARVLERCGIDIISANCSPTGHSHATWNFVGEPTRLRAESHKIRKKAETILREVDVDARRLKLRNLGTELARLALDAGVKTVQELARKNDELTAKKQDFLHRRFFWANPLFDQDDENVVKLIEKSNTPRNKAATFSWLTDLAYFWIHGTNVKAPLRFTFEENTALLRTDSPEYEELLPTELPAVSLATLDSSGGYARVSLDTRDPRFVVDFSYEADSATEGAASLGLLREICERMAGMETDLVHVSNKITAKAPTKEQGNLRFLARQNTSDVEVRRRRLEERLESIEKLRETRFTCHATVTIASARRLFVSHLKSWSDRFPKQRARLDATARAHGFVPVFVDDEHGRRDGDPTEFLSLTMNEIRASDAFLQIVPWLSDAEASYVGSWEWLLLEWGCAVGLGIPLERCMDARLYEGLERFVSVGRGARVTLYDGGSDDTDDLPAEIADAVVALSRRASNPTVKMHAPAEEFESLTRERETEA